MITQVANIIYYLCLISYSTIVIYYQSFTLRMSKFVLILIQTAVFIFSMLKLKKLTDAVQSSTRNSLSAQDQKSVMSPQVLMFNILAYLFSISTLGIEFGIAIALKDEKTL